MSKRRRGGGRKSEEPILVLVECLCGGLGVDFSELRNRARKFAKSIKDSPGMVRVLSLGPAYYLVYTKENERKRLVLLCPDERSLALSTRRKCENSPAASDLRRKGIYITSTGAGSVGDVVGGRDSDMDPPARLAPPSGGANARN